MVYEPMLDEIEQNSNGKIAFNIYPGGSLVPRSEQYDAVRNGTADMSTTYFADVASLFPLYEVFTLPAAYELTNDGEYLIQTLGNRIFTIPDATEVLCFFQQQPYYLYTSSKQVKTLDDMTGLKIVANTQLQQAVLTALGAVPIAMGQSEVYEATVKGIIDGILATPAMIDTYSLTEVYKYVLELTLGYNTGMINMNINTWTSLPDDLKTVVKEAVLKTGYSFVQQFNEDKAKVDGALIASGGTVNTLTDEEQVLWVNVFKPVIDKWVADKSARGLPVTDLLNVIRVECRNLDIPFPY